MPITWTYFTEYLVGSATTLGGSCNIYSLESVNLDWPNSESELKRRTVNYCIVFCHNNINKKLNSMISFTKLCQIVVFVFKFILL